MTWPRLSDQQKKDLARFMRYLRESDSKNLLTEYGSVSFDRLCSRLNNVFHVHPALVKSGLTYLTAEPFAHKLADSIRDTVQRSIEDKTDKYYDHHAVEQCGQWLHACHLIEGFNQ